MLQKYIMVQNKAIHPFGGTVFALDKDFCWKKKNLQVTANAASNSYNLVNLKSSKKGEKQFEISKVHTEHNITATGMSSTEVSEMPTVEPHLKSPSLTSNIPEYVNVAHPSSQPALSRNSTDSDSDSYENWPTNVSTRSEN